MTVVERLLVATNQNSGKHLGFGCPIRKGRGSTFMLQESFALLGCVWHLLSLLQSPPGSGKRGGMVPRSRAVLALEPQLR